jgi:hypothetical protein
MSKPLPTLDWLHVCDHAFRDETGKLCMIGLFDSLASVELPGRLPMLCVALGLSDGIGDYEVGLQIEAPSGTANNMKLPAVNLADRKAKARAVIRLAGMPFEEFGTYTFRLILDGMPMEWPVHQLEHVQAQQQGGGAPQGVPGAMPPPPDFPQN